MYRILKSAGANVRRGRERERRKATKPFLIATGINQVWSWDVTKIRGPRTGYDYSLLVVLDIYSRAVVGWKVVPNENRKHAVALFEEILKEQGIRPKQLKVHSDNGGVMRSQALDKLFNKFGVEASFSRPRVSDDNPFSESFFKTLKYDYRYPRSFATIDLCENYLIRYMDYYNNEHRHSGISYFTPGAVHEGKTEKLARKRQETLNAAYERNPAQFGHKKPVAKRVPRAVGINAHSAVEALNRAAA